MSHPKTWMEAPIDLPLPPTPPVPVEGCETCATCATQRLAARAKGDYSLATDASVEIRTHPHATRDAL